MVLVCKEFLKLLVEWCWLWGRRAGHPNKRGQNGPPKCGSNSGIISIYLNHSEENWLAYEKKPFRQTSQELIIVDLPLKRRSEWF